ncbi:MAG: Mrp/NBP35 family ATP-binding protein [Sphingomonadales bacterium]|jgi:ATP-binding protein involved in chromosome partitioning|nr:Mrp/NBP35 family ATP-binding protein [Sphingomonadales bacterium]MBK9267926.1 Mrp/NBP35 family ATP-binding protein [Sphingomonadales bacterium]MBP6434256.1 Mrp/NBP35 family ATP-binding protein [Sphingorhabdus sp.]
MVDIEKIGAAVAGVSQGRTSGIREKDGTISMMVDVAGLDNASREALADAIKAAVAQIAPGAELRLLQTAERNVPKMIAVASGKGGVGKSTLSANLAVAMRRAGRPAGLVDADIYGPSQPRLLGVEGVKPEAEGKKMYPVAGAGGVPFLSMGQLAAPGQPIAWRGPMAGQALSQLVDAHWGNVRELVVDMPPGTGDIQLSMIQKHKPVGAVIVSTPQDLALMDATRAIGFFNQAQVPIIGLVENMAGYVCPHCGEVSDPFGSGGAEAAAAELGIPFLGRIPLDIAVRRASDAGDPPALGDGPIAQAFADIAHHVGTWIDTQKGAAT